MSNSGNNQSVIDVDVGPHITREIEKLGANGIDDSLQSLYDRRLRLTNREKHHLLLQMRGLEIGPQPMLVSKEKLNYKTLEDGTIQLKRFKHLTPLKHMTDFENVKLWWISDKGT